MSITWKHELDLTDRYYSVLTINTYEYLLEVRDYGAYWGWGLIHYPPGRTPHMILEQGARDTVEDALLAAEASAIRALRL